MTVSGPGGVSRREAEVLEALGARLTNAQIAGRLHISIRTVESHVSSLLRKYGVTDRQELAALAVPAGELAGLPVTRTSFVGRQAEQEAISAAFATSRLVTLAGPGGVGKTRLAVAVAGALGHGGAYTDLVPVRDGFVTEAVAAALGVSEQPQQPLADAVTDRLGTTPALLVLDNCEHLLDEVAGFVDRLLARCPGVRVLTTSRERLGMPGERVIAVEPLPAGTDAVTLFHDRAAAAGQDALDPATVETICARLDGLPLAVELAAARSAALGAEGLLAALDDHLRLLAGGRGADQRHRSLRAVLAWSHNLLADPERALLRRLSAFTGAFDLPAAVAVTGEDRVHVADLLGRLVDKSLLQRGAGRWWLLETIRAFAAEHLAAAGETPATHARHLTWAATTAESLTARLLPSAPTPAWTAGGASSRAGEAVRPSPHLGEPSAGTVGGAQAQPDGAPAWHAVPVEGGRGGVARAGVAWWAEFDAVADDLRAALARAQPGEMAHRLARALGRLAYGRRFLREAIAHFRHAATLALTRHDPAEPHPTPEQAAANARDAAADLGAAAECALAFADSALAYELHLAAAEHARQAGDGDARASALARAAVIASRHPGFGTGLTVTPAKLHALAEEAATAGDPANPYVTAHVAAAYAWTPPPP
ncbi:LuxR C-terminal-related transcriptional regulator, partial [Nonomuraea sp. ATR24]|uniref:ATP-binding protein n=1 Tax=Nonomuraea sp. ATR24 TaxID=1676744 RepID=UPI0035C1A4F6